MATSTDLDALITRLPKAELHMHLEGSLEPEQMFAFAQRNKVDIPFKSVEEVKAAYAFSNLQDFLDIYYQGMGVLQTEQDFYDLTMAYLDRVHADAVRHVEVFFDPQGHTERGVPIDIPMNGVLAALKDGERDKGISWRLIPNILRHLDEENGVESLKAMTPWYDEITGIGLDSSEVGHPPSKFKRLYDRVGEIGLKRVAHAGEEGPPDYVWEALDLLNVDRIDHGNRALEDAALIKRLVDEQMTLTVCPLSNLALCVVDDLKQHPLKTMLDHGLCATVNSDDPSYFGGYMNDNYRRTAEALDLSAEDVVTLAKNGFRGSFLPEDAIARHIAEIDAAVSS